MAGQHPIKPPQRLRTPARAFQLAHHLVHCSLPESEIRGRTRDIYERTIQLSPRLAQGNFTAVGTDDLQRLFTQYDRVFFNGLIAPQIRSEAGDRFRLRLSRRLTSSGGVTIRQEARRPTPAGIVSHVSYEIAISTTLLFQTFRGEERVVRVSGWPCQDRLEALQRIFEHELIHLVEMLVWSRSKCAAARFQRLAGNFFAHTDIRHDLVLPRERAARTFQLQVGDWVSFENEGQQLQGVVNRITRRATVLVRDSRGQRYSDGQRYTKYYVPLAALRKATVTT